MSDLREQAERMVEEEMDGRVGRILDDGDGVIFVRGMDYALVSKLYELAVRLQVELLAGKQKG